jgi:hypothetical protein
MDPVHADLADPKPDHEKERGKVGLAILMWMLGVPGFIILLYLLLGR